VRIVQFDAYDLWRTLNAINSPVSVQRTVDLADKAAVHFACQNLKAMLRRTQGLAIREP
jgi:hypothetical protein